MNYLIICSFYPPDSAISAVRPYMLAKYLTETGNNVTVLRSGAFNMKPDDSLPPLQNVKVISFLGTDSDAEKYSRGEYAPAGKAQEAFASVPIIIKQRFAGVYHFIKGPVYARDRIRRAKNHFLRQKEYIDQLDSEHFDVVFSTYSELENVFAGEYAAKRFHAKWVMDFRDPIVSRFSSQSVFWNLRTGKIQKYAIENADLVTTVSEGLSAELKQICSRANIQTLYNGYDEEDRAQDAGVADHGVSSNLSFCYTGQIYGARSDALRSFARSLNELAANRRIDLSGIEFHYAGTSSAVVRDLFSEYGLSDVLIDHGRLGRGEATAVQRQCDVFLVLSWNTRRSQGVLTGKFYEGIRADKPILAVVAGDLGNSELHALNEKYGYGFCQDMCGSSSLEEMNGFIEKAYREKAENGRLSFHLSKELKEAFRYDHLAKKLEALVEQIQ